MQGGNQTNTPLPAGWAISLPSCLGGGPGTSQQVSGKVVRPSRVGAAGSPGQTVSNHAEHSTSFHSETQSQTYSRTAGSRVDSALNSFGIAGGATTAARGWEMVTWE